MSSTTESTPPASSEAEHTEGRRDLGWALSLCIIGVIVVRSFLFEPFKIPSSSMVPTLRIGDRIFVSKFDYGLAIPFTKFEFLKISAPKRGDVIVFLFPKDESLHYIKRVVGLPGDKISFKGKDLFINGELVKKERVSDPKVIELVTGSKEITGELYQETLGTAVHYVRYAKGSSYDFQRETLSEVIPPDEFFVAGDNRDDSYDSRSWGTVPRANIKGKAQIVWLSLDQEENWGDLKKIRWGRCGTLIN